MPTFLFKGGRVWDGEKFENKNVYVADGKIAYMGCGEPEADYSYDITGKILSAGFVDIHTHMKHISGDRFGFEPHLFTVPFGVTAAADCGGNMGSDELVDSLTIKAVVFASTKFADNKVNYEILEERLSRYDKHLAGIKIAFDKTVYDVRDEKPLKELAEYAGAKGLRLIVHCSGSPVSMKEYLPVLNPGDILTHAFHGGINTCADDDFESIREAQKRGIVIDVGMAAYIHADFSIFENAVKSNLIPDVISTDITKNSAYIRGGAYGLTMCMSVAMDLGMKEEDVFKCVTSNAAKSVGKESEWGCLKEGGCADLTVVDYEGSGYDMTDKAGRRVYNDKSLRCVLTMINGDIQYRI